ncbi:hypothetical protein TrVE_jg13974 [Triparma verrucosa]|uniref:Sialate O-acetylesterase domain-containing protein n=1 Tax=Triparma verrucosa TaxID=1606542 RepID=A0A9W7KUN6_9STRA|nr:hypothetical protein TrVE_jg13974 [Triparma verrucosa]
MFNDCDPKKNSLGYSPLNYLYPLYAHHHNFARGGTSLSEWLANYDSWVVAPWSRSSSGSASLKTDVVWIQGESDVANSEASYTDYHENLTTFVNKLKATVNINTLIVVLTTTTRTSLLKLPHSPKLLRSCQSRISEADFGFKINIVDTSGIRMCDDGVHYTNKGCYDVSVRLRAVLLPSPTPSPSPASLNVEEWKATMDKSAVELSKQLDENMSFGGSEKNYKMINYTYGEILPSTVEKVFRSSTPQNSPPKSLTVADLGSGCGGVLLACKMLGCLEENLTGIEVMSSYLNQSKIALPSSTLLCSDFTTDLSWVNCDLIFACSTLYDPELMSKISQIVRSNCRENTTVVTLDKGLEGCECLGQFEGEGSWGPCVVWINKYSKASPTLDGVSTNTQSIIE